MTTENQQMLAQLGLLHDDITQLPTAIRNELATAQAGYDALATDLRAVVSSESYFIATVDPDTVAPSGISGGTFNTIAAAVAASPAGSFCEVRLVAGKTHAIASNIVVRGQDIFVTKTGDGADPVVQVNAHASVGSNQLYTFTPSNTGSISFSQCDIRLPTAKPDATLGWSVVRAMVSYSPGGIFSLTTDRCTVSGGIAGDNLGLIIGNIANTVMFNSYLTTLDGPIFGVLGNGVQLVSKTSLTLLNGAAVRQSGTVGVNVLEL